MAETRVVIITKIQRKLDISGNVRSRLSIFPKVQSKFKDLQASIEGFD